MPEQLLLFDVPESEWRRRRCIVCRGSLNLPVRPGTVTYIIQRQRWVKIGKTANLAERLSVLRRNTEGCWTVRPSDMDWTAELKLLLTFVGDVEHSLHKTWANCHAAGEWFLPDVDMRTWITHSMAAHSSRTP